MRKTAPRLLIAGTGSGCGKTTAVCAILQAFKNRGHAIASYKCGPDYIDPMFHSEIIGAPSTNIDLYFAGDELARSLFMKHSAELNIIEGVMGYYDGLSMTDSRASAWHVTQVLDAPAILVVNARGMALSAAAVVKGYLEFRQPSHIAGVILNNASSMTYPAYKQCIEALGVKVYGYLPKCPECALESRHLGLVTATEVGDLKDKMRLLAEQAERSIDLDGLMELMQAQASMEYEQQAAQPIGSVRIAVAKDKAFCFYYRDNLELLEELGTEIVAFSPLSDRILPDCDGLYIGGGYPELYLDQLSVNQTMLLSIQEAIQSGLPTIAECGGFMYLTEKIADHPMVGIIPTTCRNTGKLSRFGYSEIAADADSLLFAKGETIRGHEFHYWDADDPGENLTARKESGRSWKCCHVSDTIYAGYPHLYFHSNPQAAKRFILKCLERKKNHETHGN